MTPALDPQMYHASHAAYELPDLVARLGYDWIGLSPHADFGPFSSHRRPPCVSTACGKY